MLSPDEIRKFVDLKKYELKKEKEKYDLYNTPQTQTGNVKSSICNNESDPRESLKKVSLRPSKSRSEHNLRTSSDLGTQRLTLQGLAQQEHAARNERVRSAGAELEDDSGSDASQELLECASNPEPTVSVDISRLIRKYAQPELGMLRYGEFSPNNPELCGGDRPARGDVFLGLGVYEERRKKLLQRRQGEYKEFLAKQNHLNNLNKHLNNNARATPGRNLFLEEEWAGDSHRRHGRESKDYLERPRRPSSVAVQTDPEELLALERRSTNSLITKAERELSPRPSVNGHPTPADWRMLVEKVNIGTQNNVIVPAKIDGKYEDDRLQYGKDYLDALNGVNNNMFRKDSPRARLMQDLRHTYMPSLFDADAIKQRNEQMEQETAAKRAAYQQELKNQIEDQQRIREERKVRDKLLEEAETRRLEEQLKILKMTQDNEVEKQKQLVTRMRKDAQDFERKRQKMQANIDSEKANLRNAKINQNIEPRIEARTTRTSRSDPVARSTFSKKEPEKPTSNLPFYYSPPPRSRREPEEILSYNLRRNNPYVGQDSSERIPYSMNIPESSVFAQSIPVKNYNAGDAIPVPLPQSRVTQESRIPKQPRYQNYTQYPKTDFDNISVGTYSNRNYRHKNIRPTYEPAFLSKNITEMIDTKNLSKRNYNNDYQDSLPIPVLREPEKFTAVERDAPESSPNTQAMKDSEQKWQVPAVQKNILKNNFTDDGKQANILTQLGSIRRQLQLEQLKMDQSQILSKHKLVK